MKNQRDRAIFINKPDIKKNGGLAIIRYVPAFSPAADGAVPELRIYEPS
ncbi:MAG: hypothetical protein GX937_01530 [Lentisphaerae bacterium]|nr:hypothetical protein [Lentisphaerota bacterium]